LLLPLLAIAMNGQERAPSPIEQTIESLPVPVDAEAGTQPLPPGATPLGAAGTRLPTSVTMPIYNNSAQALAARMSVTTPMLYHEEKPLQQDAETARYETLHPTERVMDDLLVGQVNTLLTSPVSPDLSLKIFQEFCNSQPGDPYYGVSITNLPIDPELLATLTQLSRLTTNSGFCPRLTEDFSSSPF
jgi:hypothetical protein